MLRVKQWVDCRAPSLDLTLDETELGRGKHLRSERRPARRRDKSRCEWGGPMMARHDPTGLRARHRDLSGKGGLVDPEMTDGP